MKKLDYYKAYEKRYKACLDNNMLWEIHKPTPVVKSVMDKYNINVSSKILDLGCGEGRDAIYLLENGYNVLAVDYSKTAIDICNKLTKYNFENNFKALDIFEDKLNSSYDFIYSICVLHMFVEKAHRMKYFEFVKNHLNENGKALIISMGDGVYTKETDINDAFKESKRININTNKEIIVANTSCKIVDWDTLYEEVSACGMKVLDSFISTDVPGFNSCMCIVCTN